MDALKVIDAIWKSPSAAVTLLLIAAYIFQNGIRTVYADLKAGLVKSWPGVYTLMQSSVERYFSEKHLDIESRLEIEHQIKGMAAAQNTLDLEIKQFLGIQEQVLSQMKDMMGRIELMTEGFFEHNRETGEQNKHFARLWEHMGITMEGKP